MSDLYEWIHDDITWCGNECSYTKCERNLANRLTKGGYYSAAMFKNTEMCPLSKHFKLIDAYASLPLVNVCSTKEIIEALKKVEENAKK